MEVQYKSQVLPPHALGRPHLTAPPLPSTRCRAARGYGRPCAPRPLLIAKRASPARGRAPQARPVAPCATHGARRAPSAPTAPPSPSTDARGRCCAYARATLRRASMAEADGTSPPTPRKSREMDHDRYATSNFSRTFITLRTDFGEFAIKIMKIIMKFMEFHRISSYSYK